MFFWQPEIAQMRPSARRAIECHPQTFVVGQPQINGDRLFPRREQAGAAVAAAPILHRPELLSWVVAQSSTAWLKDQ